MNKSKEPHFVFFEDSWNSYEPTTDEDCLEDGIDDFIPTPKKSSTYED